MHVHKVVQQRQELWHQRRHLFKVSKETLFFSNSDSRLSWVVMIRRVLKHFPSRIQSFHQAYPKYTQVPNQNLTDWFWITAQIAKFFRRMNLNSEPRNPHSSCRVCRKYNDSSPGQCVSPVATTQSLVLDVAWSCTCLHIFWVTPVDWNQIAKFKFVTRPSWSADLDYFLVTKFDPRRGDSWLNRIPFT